MLGSCTDQYGTYEQTRNDRFVSNEVQRLLDSYRKGSIPQFNNNVPKEKQENKSNTPKEEIQSDTMEDSLQLLLKAIETYITSNSDLNIPIESKFEIRGIYGCIAPYPYNFTIHQKGKDVIIKNRTDYQHRIEYRSDFSRFVIFWFIYSSIDINSLKDSYGKMASTADFRGVISINVITKDEEFSRDIKIIAGTLEDNEVSKIIRSMVWLFHPERTIPFFFEELWE
jgi:hypothetical protein